MRSDEIFFRGRTLSRGTRAFNLVELLVLLAVLAILAAVLLSALSREKQKANQAKCLSNLQQMAHALQMYIDDNDDRLPGPIWTGMLAGVDANNSEEFLHCVAPYLGIPPLGDEVVVMPVAACPAYMRVAAGIRSLQDMEGRISYLLNSDVDPAPGAPVRPFGFPNSQQEPLIRSQLIQYGSLAELYAIADADQGNMTDRSVGWWADLPNKPAHGATRNFLYFDGHVAPAGTKTNALSR